MQTQTDKQYHNTLAALLLKAEASKVKLTVDYKVAIDAYLEVISRGWALSTQETEAARLRSTTPLLVQYGFDPERIYQELVKKNAPYTIRTVFVRLKRFADFCRDLDLYKGANPFETYMRYTAPNRFKMVNVYKPRTVKMDYDQAKATIKEKFNTEEDVRESALCLLTNGLRISELYKLQQSADGNWFVSGKGSKIRSVLYPPPLNGLCARNKLIAGLASIEFTPHQLRKLMSTKLANSGISAHDLQTIMGWGSIMTAQIYLQKSSDSDLKQHLKGIL